MREHKTYLDLLRLGAAFCVVLMHTAYNGLVFDVTLRAGWLALAAVSSFTFCAVPLFFMISGYLTLESRPDVGVLLKKRIPRLLLPLLFWSLLHVLWDAYTGGAMTGKYIREGMLSALQKPANVSLWFLYSLIGMYLISPLLSLLLSRCEKQHHLLILGLIVLLKLRTLLRILFPRFSAAWLAFDVLDSLDLFGGHLCCYLLGWYLGRSRRRIGTPLLLAAAVLTFGVIFCGTVVRSVAAGTYLQDFQSQSSFLEILLAACVFLLAKDIPFRPEGRLPALLARLAPLSFGVYLSHALLLRIFGFYRRVPVAFSAIVLLTAAVYAAGLLLSALLGCVPGLRFLALGSRKTPERRKRD